MAFCFPWSGGGVLAFGNGTCVSKVCFSFSLDPLFPLGSLLVLVPNNSIFEGSGNREQAENEGVFLYPPPPPLQRLSPAQELSCVFWLVEGKNDNNKNCSDHAARAAYVDGRPARREIGELLSRRVDEDRLICGLRN